MRETQTKFLRSKVVRERYVVDVLLGQGGFGAVYRVHDRRVKNNVFALKEIVDPNQRQRKSFTFEGELLQRLDHPYLPRVYRIFEDEKRYCLYILMDYIDGPTLEHLRIQQPERRFSLAQTLKIMAPIMQAVTYLHTQTPPIIHRDIKPTNIIVLSCGDGAVLVDFGIAKEYDLNATTTAIRHCSPGYGAPEQYICNTNPYTDIYGLGATFYTLLTGEVPIDSLYRITSLSGKGTDPLIPINELSPKIPTPVVDIVQRALAINSSERFPSVEAFWEALKVWDSERVTDFLTLDVSPEQLAEVGLVPTQKLHPSTRVSTGENTFALLSTAPFYRDSLQLRQVTGAKHLLPTRFISPLTLALGAGIILAISQWLRVRHQYARLR